MNNPSSSVININATDNGNWLIKKLIKTKNKVRSNQTGKLITDLTLDNFNKRLKGAVPDMTYFARSKFSRSSVYKKNFTLKWQAVFKLGYAFCQER